MAKDLLILQKKPKTLEKPCLFLGIVIILVSCSVLFMSMQDNWVTDPYARERIVILAGGLLLSSIALCYYATRPEGPPDELQVLVLDEPPSYSSLLNDPPPPSYQSVLKGIIIIPQQSHG